MTFGILETWESIIKLLTRCRQHQALIILGSLLLLVITAIVCSLILSVTGLWTSEIAYYLMSKGCFAILLAVIICGKSWTQYGFRGGLKLRFWHFLMPLWIGAAVSLLQGVAATETVQISGWITIGIAVAFGEEGLYRGIILQTLLPNGPTTAVVVSAIIFGASHLVGVLQLDYRLVLGQAVFATGLGLALGWVRLASGSIWPCVLAHATLDATGLLAADGVEGAFQYSVQNMIWTALFGVSALSWGGYLLWKLPLSASEAPAAIPLQA